VLLIRPMSLKLGVLVVLGSGLFYLARGASVCQLSPRQAREATLKHDLFYLRVAIDNYTLDREQPPQTLKDLVDAQYIRQIPTDPMTARKDWALEFCEMAANQSYSLKGLCDLHSSSKKTGLDGPRYSDW
jgi:general secretion pathway protein G